MHNFRRISEGRVWIKGAIHLNRRMDTEDQGRVKHCSEPKWEHTKIKFRGRIWLGVASPGITFTEFADIRLSSGDVKGPTKIMLAATRLP